MSSLVIVVTWAALLSDFLLILEPVMTTSSTLSATSSCATRLVLKLNPIARSANK
jgi:hypothetical protein